MGNKEFTKQSLESSSASDLIRYADELGIDIPENLDRNFIIGELLEAAMESGVKSGSESIRETSDQNVALELPLSYNETSISASLRNPAWAFVFWDIKEADLKKIKADNSSLSLHIAFLAKPDDEKSVNSIDIQVALKDREQYVLLEGRHRYFAVQLVAQGEDGKSEILAVSKPIEIQREREDFTGYVPGDVPEMNELEKNSGLERIITEHYFNHRQSFS